MEEASNVVETRTSESDARLKASALSGLTAKINLCENARGLLEEVREDPNFTKVFSAEEIIVINQIEREIPGIAENIRKTKSLITALDFAKHSLDYIWKVYTGMDKVVSEIVSFAQTTVGRMPKRSPVLSFLAHPYRYPVDRFKIIYYNLSTKRIKRRTEKFLAKQKKKGAD